MTTIACGHTAPFAPMCVGCLHEMIVERDRLRAALERYGRHESGPDGCRTTDGVAEPCDCGLSAALAGGDGG
jgi:hypothetical protein